MPDSTGRVTAPMADPRHAVPRLRASDVDRHATVAELQDAMARGLLTPAEGSDRMKVAFAAVHLDDLTPITADLPKVAAARTESTGWRPLLLMMFEQLQSSLRSALTGRRPAQLGAALVIAFLLISCGLTFAHLVLDGGGRGRGDFGGH